MHALQDGLWDWDLRTNRVYYSSGWKSMLGYRDDELEEGYDTWVHLVDPDAKPRVESLFQDCLTGRQPSFSTGFRMRHKDGHWVDVLSLGILVRDAEGVPVRFAGTNMDVSELRQMERDLSETQRIAELGHWRLELGTERMTWSEEVYRIFGIDPQEVEASTDLFVSIVHPEDRVVVRKAFLAHLEERLPYRMEHRLLLPDGSVKHVLERCDTQYDESGAPLRSLGTVEDISRQKALEFELVERESWVRRIIDAVPDAIMVVDSDGCIEQANRGAERIFGYESRELLGASVETLMPARFRTGHAILRQRFESERSLRRMGKGRELFALDGGGREFPVEVGLAPLPGSNEGHLVVSVADISERKAAERVLRESKERLRLMTSGVRDYAIFMLDPDGRVASWNAGAQRMKGYEAQEIIGQSIACFHPPEEAASGRPSALLVEAASEGRVETQGWLMRKDGSRFFADVLITAMRDERGTLIGFSKITRDITERKAADERLRNEREQQETLRALLEISVSGAALEETLEQCLSRLLDVSWLRSRPSGGVFLMDEPQRGLLLVVSCDLDPGIADLCVNRVWVPRGCGRDSPDRKAAHSNEPNEARALSAPCMLDRDHYGLPLISKGELLGALVLHLDEDVQQDALKAQFLASTADILAGYISRESAEREVAQQHGRLEILVAERTADLDKALLEAERLAKVKDTFLATMSHEIRTPMNALLGMMELVAMRGLEDEQARMLDVARDSGQVLLRLIDDILDYSKIEAGKLTVSPEPASISEVVQLTASFFERLASSKGLRLSCWVSEEISPVVSVDRLRLRQILNNFLSNAIKFTEQGEVELGAELLEHLPGLDRVCFSVSDTGIGIAPEAQTRLFQPFSQADAETTRRFGGSGLGLAICRRLAEIMGGSIELSSAPGQGTTMRLLLDLPLVDDASLLEPHLGQVGAMHTRESKVPPTVTQAQVAGTLILLVDDHPSNRDVLTQQLELLGYASEQVVSSTEALERWKSRNYGLLITDCHMPDMDGYQLTREIRRLEIETGRRRMPVLGWTANAMRNAIDECQAAGMDDLLVKPADLGSLAAKLEQLLPLSGATPVAPDSGQRQERPPDLDEVLDPAVLRELSGGDSDMERRLLARFDATNRTDAEAIERAFADRDMKAIASLAHRIKGASSMIGARALSRSCEALELAGRDADWGRIEAIQGRYLKAYQRLRSILDGL